jgi:hypothetical protein
VLEIAEVAGLFKNTLWDWATPLRIHDPMSVKLWATGNAYAKKIEMRKSAEAEAFHLPDELFGVGTKFGNPIVVGESHYTHDITGPGTDLVDAYHLACMARYEILVRRGLVSLDKLDDKKRRVFLRVTKKHPVNLLDRPFICKGSCNPLYDNTDDDSSKESP